MLTDVEKANAAATLRAHGAAQVWFAETFDFGGGAVEMPDGARMGCRFTPHLATVRDAVARLVTWIETQRETNSAGA